MDRGVALRLLTQQLEAGKQLLDAVPVDEDNYFAWSATTSDYMNGTFGSDSQIYFTFNNAGFPSVVEDAFGVEDRSPDEWRPSLTSKLKVLESAISRLNAEISAGDSPRQSSATSSSIGADVQLVLRACRKFHAIATQLRQRREDRPTLDIADEYDVQDLLHALLRLFTDDVRAEEWTPSYAGGASRMDFLLPELTTVVETKMLRHGMTDKSLGSELLVDIARYASHQDCERLICLVYDPDHRLRNPKGLQSDLSKRHGKLDVVVVIAPPR
jgi:hypothetical protein